MSDLFISIEKAESNLLDCAAFIAERIKSSDGHAEAMASIIPRYLAKGEVDLAAELANAVDDPFSRDKLLILVAEKCAAIDDNEYALQLVDAIEDHGQQAQAFERIGLAMAAKGQIEQAKNVAEAMVHPDFVYAGIAVNQAASGNEAGADATLDEVEFPTAEVFALQQIAASEIEKGLAEKAAGSLEAAIEAAAEIEHDEEKLRAFCEIGNMFIDARRNDLAIETFDQAREFAEMLDNVHRDFFLINCALGFLHAGSTEFADRTLDLVTDKTQMASALLGFAREAWKKDEKEDAVETLEEAYAILHSQREVETRDARARYALLTTIAAQFAGFGKEDRGVEIALEIVEPNEQMAALSQIAQVLTNQKKDELARQTVNQIAEDSNRLFALIMMADVKDKLDETDGALALLDEAAGLAETVPQLAARSEVLNEIASRYASHGEQERARRVSHENFAIVTQIRDESSQAAALANLAAVYETSNFELDETEKKFLETLTRKF